MAYNISFKKRVIKAMQNINEPYYTSIKMAIYDLADNPRPHGYIKLKNRPGYRIRIGNYRVIYEIFDHELLIDIIDLGHRKDIYE